MEQTKQVKETPETPEIAEIAETKNEKEEEEVKENTPPVTNKAMSFCFAFTVDEELWSSTDLAVYLKRYTEFIHRYTAPFHEWLSQFSGWIVFEDVMEQISSVFYKFSLREKRVMREMKEKINAAVFPETSSQKHGDSVHVLQLQTVFSISEEKGDNVNSKSFKINVKDRTIVVIPDSEVPPQPPQPRPPRAQPPAHTQPTYPAPIAPA